MRLYRQLVGGFFLLMAFLATVALLGAYGGNRTLHDSSLDMIPAVTAVPGLFLFLLAYGLHERRHPDPTRTALDGAPFWGRLLVLGVLVFGLGSGLLAATTLPDDDITTIDSSAGNDWIVYQDRPDFVYVSPEDAAKLGLPDDDAKFVTDLSVIRHTDKRDITYYTEITPAEYNRRDLYAYRIFGGVVLAFNLLPGIYFWFGPTMSDEYDDEEDPMDLNVVKI